MTIIDTARLIQAVCQPLTGERATGTVFLKSATSADVIVERGCFMFPIVNGKVRYDMAFKTLPATSRGAPWTVTQAGVAVGIHSNIGGERHNLPAGTRFVVDHPLRPQLADKPVTKSGTAGATTLTGDLALHNFVTFEYFGTKKSLELFQSDIGGRFPAAIMHWVESEPADGQTTSAVTRPTHRGPRAASYSEMFEILLVSSRLDSEHERRGQALRILDELTALLLDRQAIDGVPLSSPGGIHIRGRFRAPNDDGFYKSFQVYGLRLSAQVTYTQRDSREFTNLARFKIDAPVEDDPTDLPLVVNNLVDNPQS